MNQGGPLLGKLLVDKKIITSEQLKIALREHRKTGEFLGVTLVKLGFAVEEDMLSTLSEQLHIPYVNIKQIEINPEIIKMVSARFVSHYKLLPIEIRDKILIIAVTDPLDIHTLDDLRLLLGLDIEPVLAGEKDILEGIRKYYGIGAGTVELMMAEAEGARGTFLERPKVVPERIEDLAEDASVIKFVNQLLLQAFQDRATDIHVEPYEDELKVRYRIDGMLYNINIPPNIKYFQSAIVSRIKIMADLDIAEKRLPQDGRIKIKVGENELDLRVSILPTPFGESVDVRLLSTNILLGLENLGLLKGDLEIMERLIRKPHGIILVTGPTGSGKTTTLYACLSKINTPERKIITIEDPIEYQLKGITQIQIHPKIGLSFAKGLRSMLRHDPNIMMVGEVRDLETAEIAVRVALTGHLVFSTLHTNDAPGAIVRLLDMGIEPFLVSSSLECIIAQRLVRLICAECKEPIATKKREELLEALGIKEESTIKLFEGKGCETCKFTGFRGRTGIYEILVINDQLRELILKRVSTAHLKKEAMDLGMRTLRQDGWEKVKMGLTTVDEVIRVTPEEELL